MKKEDAIRIISSCAKEYFKQLENRNLLFLFGTVQKFDCFEAAFLPRNFLHLTGIVLHSKGGSSSFYDKCLSGKIGSNEFSFDKNGTTEMKLMVLPQLMQLYKSAKMIGAYNNSKSLLVTDKLVGTVSACMGFVKQDRFYVPNTSLKEDIRDITAKPPQRVLAIFRKDISADLYSSLTYIAKGIDFNIISLNSKIADKLDLALASEKTLIVEDQSLQQHSLITESSTPNQMTPIKLVPQPSEKRSSIADRLAVAQTKIINHPSAPAKANHHKDFPEK